jgi:hypothetical protein
MDEHATAVPTSRARRWAYAFVVAAPLIALIAWRDPVTGWGERLFLPFVLLATGLVMLDTSRVHPVPTRLIQLAFAAMLVSVPLAVIDSHTSLLLRIVALPAAVVLIRWVRQAAPGLFSRGRQTQA